MMGKPAPLPQKPNDKKPTGKKSGTQKNSGLVPPTTITPPVPKGPQK